DIAGGRVTAAGSYGPSQTLQVTGVGLHGDDARALGLPLDSGTLSLAGALRGGGKVPAFTGGLVVERGRAQGYRVQGTAAVAMQGGTMRVDRAVASLGGTYGIVDGSIGNIGGGEPTYALRADVPAADIDDALSTLHVPSYRTQGVFNARLAILGSGARPSVTGTIGVPGGEVNGLPFVDARAQISARAKAVRARAGSVRVGSTDLTFFAHIADGDQALGLRAPAAHFSDFNNFFDTGDTLDGTGTVSFAVVDSARRVATRGSVDVRAFRYRSLLLGDTVANWSSQRNVVNGTLAVGGARGSLRVGGSIGLSRAATLAGLVARSRYNVTATLANLDLSTWLPALGYPEVPLLGRVDGSARVSGSYPHLAVTGDVSLAGGSFARLPIDTLTASVVTSGDLLELRAAQLQAPGLTANAIGSVGLRPGAPVRISVHASSSDVPTLVAQVARRRVDVSGTFETTLNVGGTLAAPTFDAAFDAQNVKAFGVPIVSLFGSARMNGPTLELSDIGATFAQGQATLAGTLPLQLQPFGLGPANQPISFDLALQNVDPSAFDALLGSNTTLGGALDGHVGLSGTLQAPRVFGQVRLRAGSYTSALERAPVTNAVATVDFDGTSAKLSAFQARFGAGSVAATGSAGFVSYGGHNDELEYALHANAAGAQIDLPAYGRGTLDAKFDLVRTPPAIPSLQGTMALSEATIPFSAFGGFGKGSAQAGSTARRVPDMRLDLAVSAGKNVRVRGGGVGAGLDIGATGNVAVGGTLDAPSLDGKFTSTGGTLTYFDRAFRMQSGQVVFTPSDGLQPTLHAVATTNITNPDPDRSRNPYGSADITIKVDGPLNNLGFTFTSNPPGYTRDQIIALLAPFGGFANTIAFDPNAGGLPLVGGLPGGIPVPTGQPIPGVLVQSENGTITVGQEAFNILNAQFTSGLLAPVETLLGQELGLQNLSLTVDYFGNVGLNVHRGLGHHLNAVYASTFGIPQTESFGLQYAPSDRTAAQMTFFFTNGPTALIGQPRTGSGNLRVTTGQALEGQNGFAFTLQRFF
ncbi:MAG TPA: translocation/assembly module TamB domain-containing protein, partial [Candidatus Baltobacteraceae bacterium]